jgi:protein CpxP
MYMKKAFVITLITLASLGAVIGTGYAVKNRVCHMSPAERADKITARIVKELELNDEQKVKLDAIKAEAVDKINQLHADRAKTHDEVLALVKSDRITENDINKLIEQREAKWRQIRPFVVDTIIDFHSMLTPEQRNKLAEKMETFHKRGERFE